MLTWEESIFLYASTNKYNLAKLLTDLKRDHKYITDLIQLRPFRPVPKNRDTVRRTDVCLSQTPSKESDTTIRKSAISR